MTHMRTITAFLIGAAGLVAACGDEGDTASAERGETAIPAASAPVIPENLEGRTYVSDHLMVDGTERQVVGDTKIELSFSDGSVGIRAGCNAMGGQYWVDGHRLIVAELASTAMACEPALLEQDSLLRELVAGSPQLTISDTASELAVATDRLGFRGVDVD